jgi:putative transcriptional regulator
MYKPIEVDREKLTIMGVDFSSVKDFEATASSLGSAMYEGFEPSPKKLEIVRDYITKKISFTDLVKLTKSKEYAE